MGEVKRRGRPVGYSPKKNGNKKKEKVDVADNIPIDVIIDDGGISKYEVPKELHVEDFSVPEISEEAQWKRTLEEARKQERKEYEKSHEKESVSCLKNKTINVKFINRNSGFITDPKHVNFGGMNEKAKRRYTVHLQRNGQLVNPLTDSEKDFLEEFLQMEKNSLSIYRKEDNFWKNRTVELVKGDNYLILSNPHDYISYKILLTNKDFICPSEESLRKFPKHTYQFVITSDEAELESSIEDLTGKAKAYKLFSYIDRDYEKLAYLCEKVAGKTIHTQNRDMILDAVNKMILNSTRKFIDEAENKYLDTEILLKKAVDRGIVKKIKTEYILVSHNLTLCPMGLNPTLRTACEFLNQPKNQEYLMILQAEINN